MSNKRMEDAISTPTNSSPHRPWRGTRTGHCDIPASCLAVLLVWFVGCQGVNQPYSMHGLTRVPPPNTRTGYPSTNGYYGPTNNAAGNTTSSIQPVGTVVAHNQNGAPWNGQGGLPSTDLTTSPPFPQTGIPAVSSAIDNGVPQQQFDAYGQPLLNGYAAQPIQPPANGIVSPAAANTWSNESSLNASMAGFTSEDSGGFVGSLSDTSPGSEALPSTGNSSALNYPEVSDPEWQ